MPACSVGAEFLPGSDAAGSSSWRDAKTNARDERATRKLLPRFFRESPLDATKRALARLRDVTDARLRELADMQPSHTDAIALIAESVRRSHGLVPYDVQLHAGLVLAEGRVAEMATGEGKTLVALLPAFCFALEGRGAHVATVNSYLAERDCEFARPAFARLGMSVGLLREKGARSAKHAAYTAHVTYGVGTEFGFDYLRDQLAIRALGEVRPRFHDILSGRAQAEPDVVQRSLAFAVIDEADSVLIDEARSPLIVATGARAPHGTPQVFHLADCLAAAMKAGIDFTSDPHSQRLTLTPDGTRRALDRLTDDTLPHLLRMWQEYLEQALHARHRLRRDVHYVVSEGKVVIVDEFTGRLCPDRTWRDGMHQAVEACAGVTITEENASEATITRPAYFRLYEKICGMTGTAREAAAEFRECYRLASAVIPLHRPSRRVLLPDRVFATRAAKLDAVVREIAAHHATGQPVLIGTRTIENSEALADKLSPLGIPFRVLNAKQDAEEAAIIEHAGESRTVTIATNMAGRGAHIPVPEESLRAGGLHVIGLERHESARIDRQLIGRCARQGQPGSAQFFLALDDDLLVRHGQKISTPNADGELPGEVAKHFLKAQRKAEAADLQQRRQLARYDQWIDELKQAL